MFRLIIIVLNKMTSSTGDNSRQQWYTTITKSNLSQPNQISTSPHMSQSIASSTQSLTNSVQGISLGTAHMTTQAALDNAIASIINSPTATSGLQVISSGISVPTQQISQAQSNMLKSVTLVKRNIGDTSSGEWYRLYCTITVIILKFYARKCEESISTIPKIKYPANRYLIDAALRLGIDFRNRKKKPECLFWCR